MSLFFKRTETNDEVIIVWSTWVSITPLLFMFILILPVLLLPNLRLYFLVIFILSIIILSIFVQRPTKEIQEAMKKSSVQVSGSKYSFSNPLTVRIKKEH
jgi:hypothetical protein